MTAFPPHLSHLEVAFDAAAGVAHRRGKHVTPAQPQGGPLLARRMSPPDLYAPRCEPEHECVLSAVSGFTAGQRGAVPCVDAECFGGQLDEPTFRKYVAPKLTGRGKTKAGR